MLKTINKSISITRVKSRAFNALGQNGAATTICTTVASAKEIDPHNISFLGSGAQASVSTGIVSTAERAVTSPVLWICFLLDLSSACGRGGESVVAA